MNDIGNNLKRHRLLNNLSLQEAGKLLEMSAPAIAKYEKGEIKPNSEKIIQFAKAYSVKSSELLKVYSLPKMEFKSFRKRKRLVGKNLELLEDIIQTEVAKHLEIVKLSSVETNSNKFKSFQCDGLDKAEECAEKFRKEVIKISDLLPISDLVNILENLGIVIIYINNHNDRFKDFDGLSEIVNNVPVIVQKENEDGARQRFTLAHELGHLILNIPDDDALDEEKICNRFASALLMPRSAMIQEFGERRNIINFFEIDAVKKEYKVSPHAIAYRIKDLNIISENLYKQLCMFISKNIGNKDSKPIAPEESFQFKKMVCKLEASKIISVQKAADLMGVSINEYNRLYNSNRY